MELGVGVPYVTVWLSVGMDWFLTVGSGWVGLGLDSGSVWGYEVLGDGCPGFSVLVCGDLFGL